MNEQSITESQPNGAAQQAPENPESDRPPTVADRMAAIQAEARKKVFQKREAQATPKTPSLNESEKKFAIRMQPLLFNESFKAWMEYTNLLIADRMRKAYHRPEPSLFDSQNNDRGEWMAFNHGMIVGMTLLQQCHATLCMKHVNEEERKQKQEAGVQDGEN